MSEKPVTVLFVCGANSARSQMAEGLARHMGKDRLEVRSAGVHASAVHPVAVMVLADLGVDISKHRSKSVGDLDIEEFDVVVTLCEPAREYCISPALAQEDKKRSDRSPVLSGMPAMLHWGLEDPVVEGDDEASAVARFCRIRDEISRRLEALLDQGFLEALVFQHGRWSRLVDGLEDGILAHDESRRVFLFNRAAERITGWPRDQVIGHDCHSIFTPDGLCGSQCSFCTGCAPEEGVPDRLEYEMEFRSYDGEDRSLKMSITPVELQAGRPWGVLATIRDLTEVSRLRKRLSRETSFRGMVGASASMREIFQTITQISTSDYPVLITGESGTGKELVAQAIHQESRRKAGPFVPINCGALPDNILESELFGHVRGAFTGAIRNKKGRFELADGGTILLDEVGELSPSFQVKLLRVLQEKRFELVGGEKTVQVDVRVIAATNRDLLTMVHEGTFREDLYYRLCVVPIQLPALRERTEDIPYLVEHMLARIREDTHLEIRSVSADAMRALMHCTWSGNVRQLINALQYASVRCNGEQIGLSHLPLELRQAGEQPGASAERQAAQARPGRPGKLDEASVEQALHEAKGNKVKAARLLGVGRATLYRFLAHKQ
jgi:PAS domain S-box-containing protein